MPADTADRSLTVARGLRLLRVLADCPDGLTVSALADRLGAHRPAVYRLLRPFEDERLVRRDGDGRYRLGTGLLELAGQVERPLQDAAGPALQSLADALDVTAALTVRDGEEGVVLLVRSPRRGTLHVTYRPGLRHPLGSGAPGLALLAAEPARPAERVEVAAVRDRGWALSHGELLPGATGVALVARTVAGGEPAPVALSAVWIGERDPEPVVAALRDVAQVIAADS